MHTAHISHVFPMYVKNDLLSARGHLFSQTRYTAVYFYPVIKKKLVSRSFQKTYAVLYSALNQSYRYAVLLLKQKNGECSLSLSTFDYHTFQNSILYKYSFQESEWEQILLDLKNAGLKIQTAYKKNETIFHIHTSTVILIELLSDAYVEIESSSKKELLSILDLLGYALNEVVFTET